MTCAKCNYEFCWFCKGSFFSYRHSDQNACDGVKFFKYGTAVMFIFMALCSIVYKTDLHPQKWLFSFVYEVLAHVIGAAYTWIFYG